MTELGVYLDESGTTGDRVYALGGLVAEMGAWTEMGTKWAEAIHSWGELPFFHMTDFEAYQGDYKHWTREQHEERITYLIGLIKTYCLGSVAFGVSRKLFAEVVPPHVSQLMGGEYGFMAIQCIAGLDNLIDFLQRFGNTRIPSDYTLAYILEQGAVGAPQIVNAYKGLRAQGTRDTSRIVSFDFGSKRSHIPLQPADIIAYEMGKQVERHLGIEKRRDRHTFVELEKALPYRRWNHYRDQQDLFWSVQIIEQNHFHNNDLGWPQ